MSEDPIADCVRGDISPEVAVARLLLGGASAAAIAERLDARRTEPPDPRWTALSRLLAGRAAALDRLAADVKVSAGDHSAVAGTPADGIRRIAGFFDRVVRQQPEASVALYSLGDPAILAAATAEVVDWLASGGFLPPDADVLDIGCGIGRVAAALAPRCRSVLGLDVSANMVAEARRRVPLPNARFEHTDGHGLGALPPAAFDLVLAVDSFPYIVQAGVADAHAASAARALRPGGALVVLNHSKRQDLDADRADAARWAEAHGFAVEAAGTRPFALWDGTAFALRRERGAVGPVSPA